MLNTVYAQVLIIIQQKTSLGYYILKLKAIMKSLTKVPVNTNNTV